MLEGIRGSCLKNHKRDINNSTILAYGPAPGIQWVLKNVYTYICLDKMFSQRKCSDAPVLPGLDILAQDSRFGYNWGPFSGDFIEDTFSLIFLFDKQLLFLWLLQVGASPTQDTLPANRALCFSILRSLLLPVLAGCLHLWAGELYFVKVLTLSSGKD